MTYGEHMKALSALLLLALTACASPDMQPTPRLNTETGCLASVNYSDCRRRHDLAGGYPILPHEE